VVLTAAMSLGVAGGAGPAGAPGPSLLGDNLHAVAPRRVYRSAYLPPARLARAIRTHGIRTVLNLMGGGPDDGWFRAEAAVCARLGVEHLTVSLRASRPPAPVALRQLLEVLDRAEYPLLFHCEGGADRSGLVGAVYLNVYAAVPLDRAVERQLTWRYGHLGLGDLRAADDFFRLYRRTAGGLPLRAWILERYPELHADARRRSQAHR
jgi:protein tyrosine/serine phosphatase